MTETTAKTKREAMSLTTASREFDYAKSYLQRLMIEKKLEGYKEPDSKFGRWYVYKDQLEALKIKRERRAS